MNVFGGLLDIEKENNTTRNKFYCTRSRLVQYRTRSDKEQKEDALDNFIGGNDVIIDLQVVNF